MSRFQMSLAIGILLALTLIGYGVSIVIGDGLPLQAQRVQKEDLTLNVSPPPCVTYDDVQLYGKIVQLRLPVVASFWTVADTGSMRPALGDRAFIVTVPPAFCPAIPGRIIVFKALGGDYYIMHRVFQVGNDSPDGADPAGWYARTKGDNPAVAWVVDPFLVRADQIQGVVVWGSK